MPADPAISIARQGKRQSRLRERAIATLAARQHGAISRRQLLEIGVRQGAVEHRLATARLHRIHAGVYAVGQPVIKREGRWMAAVLAAGPGAVLSHRSAAVLWRLLDPTGRAIEITAPRPLRSTRFLTRHCAILPPDEITIEDGIPVATVGRTILDLAGAVPRSVLETAIHEADHRRLYEELSVPDLLERHRGHRGCVTLRAIFVERTVSKVRLGLEDRFLDFLERADLPRPETNAPLALGGGRFIEADCLWRGARLIAELDSRAWHDDPASFESDRRRDRDLAVRGWRVVRITWRQLDTEPEALAADLRALLGA